MADGGMELGGLDVAGVRRTYWLARGPGAQAPLLMLLLPGSGTTGRDVATTFTGLAGRGPAAGVTVVFPDGWGKVWHVDGPPPGQPALDDAAFLRALACQLQGTAEPQPLFLAGISNGAGFAEHVDPAGHGDRQIIISRGTGKSLPPDVSDAPGRPLSEKGRESPTRGADQDGE